MDHTLMQQLRGNNYYLQNPRFSTFPLGTTSTPGLFASSLYQVYTPVHHPKPINEAEKQLKKEIETSAAPAEIQEGFGAVEHNESRKRKLDETILEKMMHPTFKISKLKVGKEEENKSGAGGSKKNTPEKSQKKYFKF
jgi:hypothetical protein